MICKIRMTKYFFVGLGMERIPTWKFWLSTAIAKRNGDASRSLEESGEIAVEENMEGSFWRNGTNFADIIIKDPLLAQIHTGLEFIFWG